MTPSHAYDRPHDFERLDDLIERSLADELTSEEHAELQRLLVGNVEVRREYLRLMQQHLTLTRLVGSPREPSLPADLQAADDAAGVLPVEHHSWREALTSSLDWRGHPWRFSTAVLALTVVFWGVFVGLVWPRFGATEVARPTDIPAELRLQPIVARLTGTIEATWQGDAALAPAPGSHLRLKRRLSLASGLAQLAFNKGATIVVEGPASFTLSDENGLRLDFGRIVARVPEPARGFAVETPHARIVDLGTEFGVVVEQQGQTLLHVHDGQVELALHDQPGSDSQLVVGGQAVRVEKASIRSIDLPPSQLVAFRALFDRNVPGFFKNLVVNGGFVQTADPIGWTIVGNTAGMSPNADRDTDGDGHYLGMALGNDDETHLPDSVVYQVVDVTPGQAYYFSFNHTAWATPGAISLKVDVFDGVIDSADIAADPLGDGDLVGVRVTAAADRSYQRYQAILTPTQNKVTIRFSDKGNRTTRGQDLWVDTVRLISVEQLNTQNPADRPSSGRPSP